MVSDTDAVKTYFKKLGMEPEIADIYLALHTHGPQSISELSRTARVERTRIYRLIDTLMTSNLIEVETQYKRGIIKAAPISNLHILINQREEELKNLQDELGMIEQVLARNSLSNPATRVQFYRGPEGIRQMQWNLLQAKGTIHSIMNEPMQGGTGSKFFERWADAWNKSGNTLKLLYDNNFSKLSNGWHHKHPGHHVINHHSRFLDTNIYAIKFGTDIFDNTVAYYNWAEGEIYGIEIHNSDIATAQRTFFDMLWAQATPKSVTADISDKNYG